MRSSRAVFQDAARNHYYPVLADFDSVYNDFSKMVRKEDTVTAVKITLFVVKAMRLAEQVAKTSNDNGMAKKELVIRLIERLVEDRVPDADDRDGLLVIVHTVVPPLIDQLVAADHGKLFLKAKSAIKRFLAKVGCCAGADASSEVSPSLDAVDVHLSAPSHVVEEHPPIEDVEAEVAEEHL